MASYTRTTNAIQASTSNAAAATQNSSTLTLSGGWAPLVTALITNGGTGPTLPCSATLQRFDGTTWWPIRMYSAGTTASTTYYFSWGPEIPDGADIIRVQFTGNTAQAVTVQAAAVYASSFA